MESSSTKELYLDEDMQAVLFQIINLGELLLESGAEVHRVEDTIRRLCHAYGFGRTDVFTITSSIVVTAVTQDGHPITQTRRIYRISTDLEQIDRLNSLSRKLCKMPVPLDQLKEPGTVTWVLIGILLLSTFLSITVMVAVLSALKYFSFWAELLS